MVGISKLYCGTVEESDRLRYRAGAHRRPVVVWNCTPACNLSCSHCYAATAGEQKVMDTGQALAVIDDLADFGVPVLLFSGGEPFARPDIRTLAAHAKARGLRVTFSTNGTLIDDACADWIRDLGVAYVGISIDGTEAIHDAFRRQPGAYRLALDAIRHLRDRDVKVGLRVTMTRDNVRAIPAIFDLMRAERVPRICLYHLVYTGRGKEIAATDLSHDEARAALETIIAETKACFDAGFPVEVLTVDNPCDGIALYLKMAAEGHPNAAKALELLTLNGHCISRPVLAQPSSRQRAGEAVLRDMGESAVRLVARPATPQEGTRQGPMPHLPLARPLRRQLPRARRGRHGRHLGRRPNLLPE